jgi:hypothetical protein
MKLYDPSPKKLRMFYSAKELAAMMDISYMTLVNELRRNEALSRLLASMGRRTYCRFSKAQVLEIFRVLGFPDGYEHYERAAV